MKKAVPFIKEDIVPQLKKIPMWVYMILALVFIAYAGEFVRSESPSMKVYDDQSLELEFNDRFAFSHRYWIKWKDGKWVDYSSEKPADLYAIQSKYGTAAMKDSMQGFQIAETKPYVFVTHLSPSGQEQLKETFYIRDGAWRVTNSEMNHSESYDDYMWSRYGDGGYVQGHRSSR